MVIKHYSYAEFSLLERETHLLIVSDILNCMRLRGQTYLQSKKYRYQAVKQKEQSKLKKQDYNMK